jgi:hydrogenase expression/formation protein HypD
MSDKESMNQNVKMEKPVTWKKQGHPSRAHLLAVCSGYHAAIRKNKSVAFFPQQVEISYGPGCPACLVSPSFIDKLLAYSRRANVIIATYNDLLGIPGSQSTLEKARTAGADIRVVTNIWDVLVLAKKNRRKRIVFPALGFESAASSTAAAILQAKVAGVFNFQVLSDHRRMPACIETVLQNGQIPVDGILASGRVAASMGAAYFRFLSEKYHLPVVISGYEPGNIKEAVSWLLHQIENHSFETGNLFPEAVSEEGNPKSHQLLEEVFTVSEAFCNGQGMVKDAGFAINNAYRMFDAEKVFVDTEIPEPAVADGCLCSEIMWGIKTPQECPYFAKQCNPVQALGACMHSEEGPCRVEFLFGSK